MLVLFKNTLPVIAVVETQNILNCIKKKSNKQTKQSKTTKESSLYFFQVIVKLLQYVFIYVYIRLWVWVKMDVQWRFLL